MNIYDRIRMLRKEEKLTQEELASKVGYTDRTMIAKIESGRVDIPQSKIALFASALNTSTAYLLDGNTSEFILSENEKALVIKFRSTSPDIRRAVMAILNIGGYEAVYRGHSIVAEDSGEYDKDEKRGIK